MGKVVLVSLAEDENVLPRFRAALAGELDDDQLDVGFAHTVPGVVGLGRIGALTAQRADALGMRVLAWAPRTPETKVRALGALPCQALAAVLAASDVVSLHLPLTAETKGIIDAAALAAMRPGSYLNGARITRTCGHVRTMPPRG